MNNYTSIDENNSEIILKESSEGTNIGMSSASVLNVAVDGGTMNHNLLNMRDSNNAHPISAITGLQDKLDSADNTITDLRNDLDVEIVNVDSKIESTVASEIGNITDGTPLFAESISHMTDTSRVYVNTSNGYIYKFGVTKNVYNPDDLYVEIDDDSITTGYIRVSPGDTFTASWFDGTDTTTYLGGAMILDVMLYTQLYGTPTIVNLSNTPSSYTIPNGITYVRFRISDITYIGDGTIIIEHNEDKLQIEKGATYTSYAAYAPNWTSTGVKYLSATTQWYAGNQIPTAYEADGTTYWVLTVDGATIGDYYLNTDTYKLYKLLYPAPNFWTLEASGLPERGTKWFYGTQTPHNTGIFEPAIESSIIDDFYLNIETGNLYVKKSEYVWELLMCIKSS